MQFVIGVDYGTLSARAIVTDMKTGRTLGEKVCVYAHGVMETALPDGTPLPGTDWALADPRDYYNALVECVRGAVAAAGVSPVQIGALAIAATACTLMPVDENLVPLCAQPRFSKRPHAYAKLWKHHRAQSWADKMTAAAQRFGLAALSDYGGKISSEWAFPKILEVLHEDAECYEAADRFMQFSDWLTALLTGDHDVQNGSIAMYKAMWSPKNGMPPDAYFELVDPRAVQIVHQKLRGKKLMAGARAGTLVQEMAQVLGLEPGTVVGMAHTDAHAAALGAGIKAEGDYVYILGTSTCGHLLSQKKVAVQGVTASLSDALLAGYTCYSAGQACAGDMLDWFMRRALPTEEMAQAQQQGRTAHAYLEEKAARQRPGECALVALDWWNGNRSTLVNANLSGLLVGLTMETTPTDIYRALLDAIAFGHREIIENFTAYGLTIRNIIFCGGIAQKNRLLIQIMADVLNRNIQVSAQTQATALGASMCAAAALGTAAGGYASVPEAVKQMQSGVLETFHPLPENVAVYNTLYQTYDQLYTLFGKQSPELMRRLRANRSNES